MYSLRQFVFFFLLSCTGLLWAAYLLFDSRLVPAGDRDDWPHSSNKCSCAHPLAEKLDFSPGDPEHEKFLVLHNLLPYHLSQKTAAGKYLPHF